MPTPKAPHILTRSSRRLSDWVEIEEVVVRMPGLSEPQTYHGIRQADAVNILALTEDGLVPVIRQFRPIVGAWTYELPGGLVDAGEDAATTAARELMEETGLEAIEIVPLVETFEDTARLTNRYFGFFALVRGALLPREEGISAELIEPSSLKRMAAAGEIGLPSNMGCMYLAACNARVRELCRGLGYDQVPWL